MEHLTLTFFESASPRQFYLAALRAYLKGNISEARALNRVGLDEAVKNESHLDLAFNLILKIKIGSENDRLPISKSDFESLKVLAETLDDPELSLLYGLLCAEFPKLVPPANSSEFDVVFNVREGLLHVGGNSVIDLRHQYVLADLLILFMRESSSALNKNQIVERVWGRPYNALRDANLVYVTLRRLRVIFCKAGIPNAIQRTKQGYLLNRNLKTKIILGFTDRTSGNEKE